MKKAVIALMAIIMSLTAVFIASGCTGSTENTGSTQNNDALLAEIEDLKDRVEDLENKNNVFWTDKAEYAETETMTVYFKDTAVFKIRLYLNEGPAFWYSGSHSVINGAVYITSLQTDVYSDAVISTSYILWSEGACLRNQSTSINVLEKNVETSIGSNYNSGESYEKADQYDFVICVPGTQFELARFKNVSIEK